MAPDDESQPVLHAELHGHVRPELDPNPSLRLELPIRCGGVAPEEVREDLVLDVGCHGVWSRDIGVLDGVYVINREGLDPSEAAMDDEDLLLHHCADSEGLKGAHKAPVRRGAVFAKDLVTEATTAVEVQRVHILVLVVPAVHDEALGIGEEEGEKDQEDLRCLMTSVCNVAIYEVPVLRRRGSELVQDVKHISQLPVRIPDYD
mmetsp:Transcript_107863/g.322563  ORF Transcript_107863/g.322563 Transcript_107863/m.322563 type:complete len:204 (+) Transcript_107863:1039-1650(+)